MLTHDDTGWVHVTLKNYKMSAASSENGSYSSQIHVPFYNVLCSRDKRVAQHRDSARKKLHALPLFAQSGFTVSEVCANLKDMDLKVC